MGIKICFQFDRSTNELCLLINGNDITFVIELDDTRKSAKIYKPAMVFRYFYENKLKSNQNPTLPIDRSILRVEDPIYHIKTCLVGSETRANYHWDSST